MTTTNLILIEHARRVWRESRRGKRLHGLDAAMATAMELHTEWWSRWDALTTGYADDETLRALRHIQEDASIVMQIFSDDPIEIHECYEALIAKGFSHLRAIHTIGLALTDELSRAGQNGEEFNVLRYVRGARTYADGLLKNPAGDRFSRKKWSEVSVPELVAAC
jgi:hypothetical protein